MANLTLEEAIAKAQMLADAPLEQDVEFLSDLLIASAGVTAGGLLVYRYYYAAAKRLQTNLEVHALSDAENGVKFTGQAVPIEALLNLQLAIDLSIPLSVPAGFTAVEALKQLCGCGSGGAIAMSAFVV